MRSVAVPRRTRDRPSTRRIRRSTRRPTCDTPPDGECGYAGLGMREDEELAVRIVVAEGILSGDEAGALHDEAARAGQGLLERLRTDGRISEPTFASLCVRVTE